MRTSFSNPFLSRRWPAHPCAAAFLIVVLAGAAVPARAATAAQDPPPPVAPQPVAAPQVTEERPLPAPPFRGLFGAGSPAAAGGHALDLTGFVYQEYGNTEDHLNADLTPVLTTGWYSNVRGALSFQKAGRYTQFGLRGEGAFRYYPEGGLTTAPRVRVDLGLDSRLGARRRDVLRVSGFVDRQPYYTLPLFAQPVVVTGGTAILPPNRDDLLVRRDRYIYGQAFGLEHQLSPRTFVTIDQSARYTRADQPGLDVHALTVGARYAYRLSANTAVGVGYAYQTGRYGPGAAERLTAHDIDVSVNVQKPLTRSRRTTLGLSTASSRVGAGGYMGWKILGAASLRHEFNHGWFVEGRFGRDVQLVEGFEQPFFANTATASVGGFLGRRVELLTSGGYSQGLIGFSSDKYDALQGSVRLRVALARFLAIDAEGLTNQYAFPASVALPAGVPANLNRWAVRWSMSLWLPLSR